MNTLKAISPNRFVSPKGSYTGVRTEMFSGTSRESSQFRQKNTWNKPPWYKRLFHFRYHIELPVFFLSTVASVSSNVTSVLTAVMQSREHKPANAIVVQEVNHPQSNHLHLSKESITSVVAGILITLSLIADRSPSKRKVSAHELGHFLSQLGTQSRATLLEVTIDEDSGHVASLIDKADNNAVEWRKNLITYKGGIAMERLLYGYSTHAARGDYMAAVAQLRKLLDQDLKQDPKNILRTLSLWWHGERQAMELLMRLNPETIEQLTTELCLDQKWDQKRIDEIIEKYHLREQLQLET